MKKRINADSSIRWKRRMKSTGKVLMIAALALCASASLRAQTQGDSGERKDANGCRLGGPSAEETLIYIQSHLAQRKGQLVRLEYDQSKGVLAERDESGYLSGDGQMGFFNLKFASIFDLECDETVIRNGIVQITCQNKSNCVTSDERLKACGACSPGHTVRLYDRLMLWISDDPEDPERTLRVKRAVQHFIALKKEEYKRNEEEKRKKHANDPFAK